MSDAYQMGASWHQACLALECNLPLLPLLNSLPLPSTPPSPIFVRGETGTTDIQTTQHAYSDVTYVRLSWILSLLMAFTLVDKIMEISLNLSVNLVALARNQSKQHYGATEAHH